MKEVPHVRLETLAANRAGAMVDGPFGSNLKASEYVDTGVPIVRLQNIRRGHFRSKDIKFVTEDKARELARHTYEPGDIVIAKLGECGAACIVPQSAGRGIIVADVVRFRGDQERVDHRYLVHFLNTPLALRQIGALSKGTTRARVNLSDFKGVLVPLPSLSEQRRIADILDKADAIRRKRGEAIALTEELLRSAFLEMFGDPVTNPKGWPVKTLGELLQAPLRNGLSPASGGKFEAQVLTLSAITRGQFDASASKSGAFAVEPWEDVRVDARDFLICRGNGNVALVGSAAFPRESMKNMVFPDTMIAARIDQARVRPAFLNAIWKSPFIRLQVEAGARTTNGTFKINQTVVEGIEIILPPPANQQVFADLEARVAKTADRQRAAIEGAADLFNSLVARAFSGALEATR